MAVIIHPAHRKLAELIQHAIDPQTNEIRLGEIRLNILLTLLTDNLNLVRRTDELKHLALEAQTTGDMEWVQEITIKLDEMEAMYS